MSSPSSSSLSDSGATKEDWQRGWLELLLWVTATPFPPHLPVPIGCPGLCHPVTAGTTDTAGTLGSSHIRASWVPSSPLNLSLKTPPWYNQFPSLGDASFPPPQTLPPPPPGQDMVVQGWEQPRSHGTGSGAGPPEEELTGTRGTLLCSPKASPMHHPGISCPPWLGRGCRVCAGTPGMASVGRCPAHTKDRGKPNMG